MGHPVDAEDVEVVLLSGQVNLTSSKARCCAWVIFGAAVVGLCMFSALALTFHSEERRVLCGRRSLDMLCNAHTRLQPKAPVKFLVVGDWGRNGKYNQTFVAEQMGKVGAQLDINFVISTGDNFYDSGLTGPDDNEFTESFSNIYTQPSLQKTWYTVLGNHDYRGNVEAELDEKMTVRDSRWFCHSKFQITRELSPQGEASHVEFFFIDTNPFKESYWTEEDNKYTWQLQIPREEYIADQLQNLTNALEASKARWKIVVGHHTMRSIGNHCDTDELIARVLPILEANGVDVYINGHDHCLQHIKRSDSPLHFLTSGGGSKAWKGISPPANAGKDHGLVFYYDGQGFAAVSITPTLFHMAFYDIYGNGLHMVDLSKS